MFIESKPLKGSNSDIGGKHKQSKVFAPRCAVCNSDLDIHKMSFPGCCSRDCAVKSKSVVNDDVFDVVERDISKCCCCGRECLVSVEGRICKVIAYRCIECRTGEAGSLRR